MANASRTRKHRRVCIFLAILLVVGGIGSVWYERSWLHARDKRYTASCANHFVHHNLALRIIADDHPNLVLPSTSDTRAALLMIYSEAGDASLFDKGRLHSWSAACPEAFKRDASIGYVYVGDGMRLGQVLNERILILFRSTFG